jgi:hypothetical protein
MRASRRSRCHTDFRQREPDNDDGVVSAALAHRSPEIHAGGQERTHFVGGHRTLPQQLRERAQHGPERRRDRRVVEIRKRRPARLGDALLEQTGSRYEKSRPHGSTASTVVVQDWRLLDVHYDRTPLKYGVRSDRLGSFADGLDSVE